MGQEDYIKKQIDQLGRILGKLLADLAGLKNSGRLIEGLESTNQLLKEELGTDLNEIGNMSSEKFIQDFIHKPQLNNIHLEILADILLLHADDINDVNTETKKKLYRKVLDLLTEIEKTGNVYVYERHQKIDRIMNFLGESK